MKKAVFSPTLAVVLIIVVNFVTQVGAEPGKLDPTFGFEGVTLVDFGGLEDLPNAAALQDDGKILVSGWVNIWPGDFGTVRLLSDGSLDSSFGSGGKVTTAFSDNPDNVDAAWSVTAGPNGRVYVSGETCDADYFICEVATAVYKEDGSLDETFAGDGKTSVSPGTDTVYA
ncbi:MAG: delta-60 repeat domain-containing protein [Candidatus Promineifilaceae bacterium]|nr:delta-60 repeat domain-containing protein [Candidatus Promineifilaceae bacterium]